MEIKINKLQKSELEIEIELIPQEWDDHLESAVVELSKELKIDGFRPGKAPRNVIEARVGSKKLMEIAAETAIRKSYVKAVVDNNLEAIGQPEIQVTKIGLGSPFVFKAKIAVLPELELGNYKKIAREIREKMGDELIPTDKDIEVVLHDLRKLRTMRENKEVEKIKSDQELILPELNDDFAKSLGNFESLEALKSSVRDGLVTENRQKEKQRWRIETINKIADASRVEVPEILIESELNKMLVEFKNNIQSLGLEFDKYLLEIKQTEEELRKSWHDQAVNRVKAALTLKAIAKEEKLIASEQEIEEEINKFIKNYNSAEVDKIDMDYLKEYTKSMLKNEKVFQFLEGLKA